MPENTKSPETERSNQATGSLPLPFVDVDGLITTGCIVGVVTSLGVVESHFTGAFPEHHEKYWKIKPHCCWRWDSDKSIHWLTGEHKPDEEQYTSIQTHLTKRYGIQWFENGHHDWEHLGNRQDELEATLQKENELNPATPHK